MVTSEEGYINKICQVSNPRPVQSRGYSTHIWPAKKAARAVVNRCRWRGNKNSHCFVSGPDA